MPVVPNHPTIPGMLIRLFDHWGLAPEEQLDALGLPNTRRALFSRYRRSKPPSPTLMTRDALERANHLLWIHKTLRELFPHNRDLAYRWMTTRNRAFGWRTPIGIIGRYGFAGLLMVRTYLDRARGQ